MRVMHSSYIISSVSGHMGRKLQHLIYLQMSNKFLLSLLIYSCADQRVLIPGM